MSAFTVGLTYADLSQEALRLLGRDDTVCLWRPHLHHRSECGMTNVLSKVFSNLSLTSEERELCVAGSWGGSLFSKIRHVARVMFQVAAKQSHLFLCVSRQLLRNEDNIFMFRFLNSRDICVIKLGGAMFTFMAVDRTYTLAMLSQVSDRMTEAVNATKGYRYMTNIPNEVIHGGGKQALEVYRDAAPMADGYLVPEDVPFQPNDYQRRALGFLQYRMHSDHLDVVEHVMTFGVHGRYHLWCDLYDTRSLIVCENKPDHLRVAHRIPRMAVLAGSTGIGKSYAVLLFAQSHYLQTGERAKVVVPTDTLATQWLTQVSHFGVKCEAVEVVTWDQVMKGPKKARVSLEGGLIFFDEAHKIKSTSARWRKMFLAHMSVLVTATPTNLVRPLCNTLKIKDHLLYSHLILYDSFDLTHGLETQMIDCAMSVAEQDFFDKMNAYLYKGLHGRTLISDQCKEIMRVMERVMSSGVFDADFQVDRVIARLEAMAAKEKAKELVKRTGDLEKSFVVPRNTSCVVCMVEFGPHVPCASEEEFEGQAPRLLTSCLHLYCYDCLSYWLKRDRSCPMCRSRDLTLFRHYRPMPENWEADKKKREAEVEAREVKRRRKEEAPLAFNSKHERFLEDLEVWRERHGGTDTLIVAADPEASDWYARTLGVPLCDFEALKTPGGVAVMPMTNHEGLDLKDASHVWLMTSGGGRAYELVQMVGRVTRFSQEKKVYVRYYLYPFGRFLVEYNRTGNLNPTKSTMALYLYHLYAGELGHARRVVEKLTEVNEVNVHYPRLSLNKEAIVLNLMTGVMTFGKTVYYHYRHWYELDANVSSDLPEQVDHIYREVLEKMTP